MEENKIVLGELTENEKRLVFAIRNKYKFSELTILTRNGQPVRLKQVEFFEDLTGGSEGI